MMVMLTVVLEMMKLHHFVRVSHSHDTNLDLFKCRVLHIEKL